MWGALLSLVCLLCFVLSPVRADVIWAGTSGSADWSNSANWQGGVVPGANDIVTFPSTSSSVVSLGGNSITIASLNIQDRSKVTLTDGTLTVTELSYIGGGLFDSLTLATQVATKLNNTIQITDTQWTATNAQVYNCTLTLVGTSTFTNPASSVFATDLTSVLTLLNGNTNDYSVVKFINEGTMRVSSPVNSRYTSGIGVCFTNKPGAVFEVVQEFFMINGSQQLDSLSQQQGLWDGSVQVPLNSTLIINGGQHVFQPNVDVSFKGDLQIKGYGADFYDPANVTFKLPLSIPYLYITGYVDVSFLYDTDIDTLEWNSGIISSWANYKAGIPPPTIKAQVLIARYHPGFSPISPQLFTNLNAVNGSQLWGRFEIGPGAVLTAEGYWTMEYTFWYAANVLTNDRAVPGTFRIAPTATIEYWAGTDNSNQQHIVQVNVANDGLIITSVGPTGSCLGTSTRVLVLFNYASNNTGTFSPINCGRKGSNVEVADMSFRSDSNVAHVFNEGTQFTGAGVFLFYFGQSTFLFSNTYYFSNQVKSTATIASLSDIHFSYFSASGCTLKSATNNPVTYYVDASPNLNSMLGSQNYPNTADNVQVVINGLMDLSGAFLQSKNSGFWVNNGNVTANSYMAWAPINPQIMDDQEAIFINNMGLGIAGGSITANLYNRGDLTIPLSIDRTSAERPQFLGKVSLASNSTVYLSVYGDTIYDALDFGNSPLCEFGGNLVVNFQRYTPTVGQKFPLIVTANVGECPLASPCTGAFASVSGKGLGPNQKLGLLYDQDTGNLTTFVVVCDASNTSCTALTRTPVVPCSNSSLDTGASTISTSSSPTTGSGTTGSTGSTGSTSPSSTGPPTSGNSTGAPTSGNSTGTPTSGNSTGTPTSGNSTTSKPSTTAPSTSPAPSSSSSPSPTPSPTPSPSSTTDNSVSHAGLLAVSLHALIICIVIALIFE